MRSDKLLLEGRPGVGKTTVIRELLELLREAGQPVAGFTTEEIRRGRSRMGFRVEAVGGERAVLAHVDLAGPPRVGRYGVDLEALERVALPELQRREGVLVVDELGKMELASSGFRSEVERVFDDPGPVVATVHVARHPLTDALKAAPGVLVLRVEESNRNRLAAELVEGLLA